MGHAGLGAAAGERGESSVARIPWRERTDWSSVASRIPAGDLHGSLEGRSGVASLYQVEAEGRSWVASLSQATSGGRSVVASLKRKEWLSQDAWLRSLGTLVDDGEMPSTSGVGNLESTVLDYNDDGDLEEGEIVEKEPSVSE